MYSKEVFNQVMKLKNERQSLNQISKIVNIARSTVQEMIKPSHQKKYDAPGRPKIRTKSFAAKVKRCVDKIKEINEKVSAKKVKSMCKLHCSTRTIQKTLNDVNLKYATLKQKIILSEKQKEIRIKFIKEWMKVPIDFKSVIFTDEKKFNFDGPDNYKTWIYPNENVKRSKRPLGGGGLMVYGAILPDGTIYIEKFSSNINSSSYIEMVEEFVHVIPCIDEYWLMQDNARPHISKQTMEYFQNKHMKLLQWPPYSPDINIMEDIWHMISEIVYDGPQFRSKESLWNAIQEAVEKLKNEKRDVILRLFDTYVDRLCTVIIKNGDIFNK